VKGTADIDISIEMIEVVLNDRYVWTRRISTEPSDDCLFAWQKELSEKVKLTLYIRYIKDWGRKYESNATKMIRLGILRS